MFEMYTYCIRNQFLKDNQKDSYNKEFSLKKKMLNTY
jgi:hypothetical protein